MGRALPNWLIGKYFSLLASFDYLPFSIKEAKNILGAKTPVVLSKLNSYGWVSHVGRGTYRVVHPIVAIMEASGNEWREKVMDADRLPILELAVSRMFEVLGGKLESIVLFGSLARGVTKPYSDIDLLVIAKEIPKRYSDRVKIINKIKSSKSIDELIVNLWRRKGVYADFDILLLDEEEASRTHPFYIDMTEDRIMIFDRNGLISKKLKEVRKRLKSIGAVKVEEADGSWYWILTPKPELVKGLEL